MVPLYTRAPQTRNFIHRTLVQLLRSSLQLTPGRWWARGSQPIIAAFVSPTLPVASHCQHPDDHGGGGDVLHHQRANPGDGRSGNVGRICQQPDIRAERQDQWLYRRRCCGLMRNCVLSGGTIGRSTLDLRERVPPSALLSRPPRWNNLVYEGVRDGLPPGARACSPR